MVSGGWSDHGGSYRGPFCCDEVETMFSHTDFGSRLRSDTNPPGGMWGDNGCSQKGFNQTISSGAILGGLTHGPAGAVEGAVLSGIGYLGTCWW